MPVDGDAVQQDDTRLRLVLPTGNPLPAGTRLKVYNTVGETSRATRKVVSINGLPSGNLVVEDAITSNGYSRKAYRLNAGPYKRLYFVYAITPSDEIYISYDQNSPLYVSAQSGEIPMKSLQNILSRNQALYNRIRNRLIPPPPPPQPDPLPPADPAPSIDVDPTPREDPVINEDPPPREDPIPKDAPVTPAPNPDEKPDPGDVPVPVVPGTTDNDDAPPNSSDPSGNTGVHDPSMAGAVTTGQSAPMQYVLFGVLGLALIGVVGWLMATRARNTRSPRVYSPPGTASMTGTPHQAGYPPTPPPRQPQPRSDYQKLEKEVEELRKKYMEQLDQNKIILEELQKPDSQPPPPTDPDTPSDVADDLQAAPSEESEKEPPENEPQATEPPPVDYSDKSDKELFVDLFMDWCFEEDTTIYSKELFESELKKRRPVRVLSIYRDLYARKGSIYFYDSPDDLGLAAEYWVVRGGRRYWALPKPLNPNTLTDYTGVLAGRARISPRTIRTIKPAFLSPVSDNADHASYMLTRMGEIS